MSITDLDVAKHILKQVKTEVGTLFFFNHIAVVEFDESAHVDLISAQDTIHNLMSYFGQSRPFGLIANRINSYSISLLDVQEIKPVLQNMIAYGVVSHDHASKMGAEIENGFCESQQIHFKDIHECLNSVYSRVRERLMLSLN
ncbi:hypothetical protein [Winogradskyella sp.]|uniref:hypothetical protein n=1 Tax=Winogradskyella sp. TaxID=1883156 RepID=UPI0026275D81|nr:hypothetical protein [Winogradskyella sp.]